MFLGADLPGLVPGVQCSWERMVCGHTVTERPRTCSVPCPTWFPNWGPSSSHTDSSRRSQGRRPVLSPCGPWLRTGMAADGGVGSPSPTLPRDFRLKDQPPAGRPVPEPRGDAPASPRGEPTPREARTALSNWVPRALQRTWLRGAPERSQTHGQGPALQKRLTSMAPPAP